MAKLQPVRGTRDILGDDGRRFRRVVDAFRDLAERYGFDEIQTPIFEFSEVFKRTLGETSDVVSKEMYTFRDRGNDEITLRPENTAGIARAYIAGLQSEGQVKLYAHGPMFRYERPQKGRYRQFHQLDAEIIGVAGPAADIEIIALGHHLLKDMGVGDSITLHLNSLGDPESRAAFRAALVDYFSAHADVLSEDSRERLTRNPLRILDSKDQGDRALLADAPRFGDHLNQDSSDFFTAVRRGLDVLGIDYVVDEKLVRGLDYYTHTAFEFISTDLGAQGTVIGGGRYDGLIAQMGGPATPGVGWAGGIERLAMLLAETPQRRRPVAVIGLGQAAEARATRLVFDLRDQGFRVEQPFRGNLKKRMGRANRVNARWVVIIGDDELARGEASLRDLDSGEQRAVSLDSLADALGGEP